MLRHRWRWRPRPRPPRPSTRSSRCRRCPSCRRPSRCPPRARARGWFYSGGDYPLKEALHAEVAHVLERHPRLSVADYRARLDSVLDDPAMRTWREKLGSPTGHDLDLARTFALSWQQIEGEAARRLLREALASHLASGLKASVVPADITPKKRLSGSWSGSATSQRRMVSPPKASPTTEISRRPSALMAR